MDAALRFLHSSDYVPVALSPVLPFLTPFFHIQVYLVLSYLGIAHGEEHALALFGKSLALDFNEAWFIPVIRFVFNLDFDQEHAKLIMPLRSKVLEICWEHSKFLVLDEAFMDICNDTPSFNNAYIAKITGIANAYHDMLPLIQDEQEEDEQDEDEQDEDEK